MKVGEERTMFRYLRTVIFSLTVGVAIMPVSTVMAEDITTHPQISSPSVTADLLIRVQYDPQCRRNCDTEYAGCVNRSVILIEQGAPPENAKEYNRQCNADHRECYRSCD